MTEGAVTMYNFNLTRSGMPLKMWFKWIRNYFGSKVSLCCSISNLEFKSIFSQLETTV